MWKVTIRDKGIKDELITVQVEFSQGDESIVRNLGGNSKSEIDKLITNQLDALEKRDEEIESVTVGEWNKPAQEIEKDPTPEEAERDAWIEQWESYRHAKKAMEELAEAGIEPTEEEIESFEALKKWVADNRKIEYSQYVE